MILILQLIITVLCYIKVPWDIALRFSLSNLFVIFVVCSGVIYVINISVLCMVYVIDISYHILRHKCISDIAYFINISVASEREQLKQTIPCQRELYFIGTILEPEWTIQRIMIWLVIYIPQEGHIGKS